MWMRATFSRIAQNGIMFLCRYVIFPVLQLGHGIKMLMNHLEGVGLKTGVPDCQGGLKWATVNGVGKSGVISSFYLLTLNTEYALSFPFAFLLGLCYHPPPSLPPSLPLVYVCLTPPLAEQISASRRPCLWPTVCTTSSWYRSSAGTTSTAAATSAWRTCSTPMHQ